MAAAKKRAAKYGDSALAAGRSVRENEYVRRIVEDDDLRENLRSAFESAKKAYSRMSNGSGPAHRAVLEDKKTQRELKEAAASLSEAADSLRGKRRKRRTFRKLLLVGIVGAGLALVLSEGLRKQVLDALFGAEEEFEYTSSTTPEPAASEPVGSSASS